MTIVAYIPVIHRGYLDFFEKHKSNQILLFDREMVSDDDCISRDMRALRAEEIRPMLSQAMYQTGRLAVVSVASETTRFEHLQRPIIMPDEDVSHAFASRHFPHETVVFDPTFLRWNWGNVKKAFDVIPDHEVSSEDFILSTFQVAEDASKKSSDWWRQVGAVLFRGKDVIVSSYNKHMPHHLTPYILGDPRSVFRPGESIEISSAQHAEKSVIMHAARKGISTDGCSILVTVFPCPQCAMDIVESGIREVYYREGYSLVKADEILRARDVRIVRIV